MMRSSGKQQPTTAFFFFNKRKGGGEIEGVFCLFFLISMDCEGQEEIDPQRPVKVRSNLIRVVQIWNIF